MRWASWPRQIAAKCRWPCRASARRRSTARPRCRLADAYAYAADVMVRNMLARDAAEGIDAFLQKRAPVWA